MLMKLLIGILFGVGLYFILADVYRIPYVKTSKTIRNLQKAQKETTSTVDVWLGNLASLIAKKIRVNEYKRIDLERDLTAAQKNITPEMFMANAIVKSLLIGVLAIPMYFIFPIVSPVIIFLAFVLYKMNMKSVSKATARTKEKIEDDLPRLVNTVEKNLDYKHNVLDIITDFIPYANPELRRELEITTADMRSGNELDAIIRLEKRTGSPMMHDVCQGFATMLNGNADTIFWSALSEKFGSIRRNKLKAKAEKVPKKVKRLSMCLLICFLLIYIVVIIAQISGSLGMLFG